GAEVAVLFVRLGGLTEFTRGQGTLKGDEAVTSAADIIRQTVRRVDIVTRFEDDTFALILPHTGQNVCIVHQRPNTALGDWLEEKGWDTGRCPVTLSFGAAIYPCDTTQASPLTALAQERMAPAQALPQAA